MLHLSMALVDVRNRLRERGSILALVYQCCNHALLQLHKQKTGVFVVGLDISDSMLRFAMESGGCQILKIV